MDTQHEITLDEHLRWFGYAAQEPGKYPLIPEDNHRLIGMLNFNEGQSRRFLAGVGPRPDAPKGRGQMFGNEALDYAFGQLKLHKLASLASNQRSIRPHNWLAFRKKAFYAINTLTVNAITHSRLDR
jgi:RimJ/RimL family protein N-acetyltransferase